MRNLFSDDPIDGVNSFDDLDRMRFVDQTIRVLDRVADQSESSVIALVGPWGSGKSSVLRLALQRIASRSRHQWLTADFNPWSYPDIDTLQLGFFTELRNSLPDNAKWSEARKTIGEFGRTISPIAKIGGLIGLDFSDVIESLSDAVSGDTSASTSKLKAEDALRKLDRPLLVVLDDLDRLTPDELLRVFKLVRFVGRLPNVYYLLCYDERTLLDVLSNTDLVTQSSRQRAQDYVEKIVQIRLDLPVVRSVQASKLFDMRFESVTTRLNIQLDAKSIERLAGAYWDCMHNDLSTPRSISRFVAQLDAISDGLSEEVDFADFTLITWLRTAWPSVYTQLALHRPELTYSDYANRLVSRGSPKDELPTWTELLESAGVPPNRTDGFLKMLARLFPRINSAITNATDGTATDRAGRRRGVGHPDYFDRYFAFGVPQDDIADARVAEAVQMLRDHELGPAVDELVGALSIDGERVIRKLRTLADTGATLPYRELLPVLASLYPSLPEGLGIFVPDPKRAFMIFTADSFKTLTAAEQLEVARGMSNVEMGLALLSRSVAYGRSRAEAAEFVASAQIHELVIRYTADSLEAFFNGILGTPLANWPSLALPMLWDWRHVGGSDRSGQWTRAQVQQGIWNPVDALALLVPTAMRTAGDSSGEVLHELDRETVDAFFEIDDLLLKASADISSHVIDYESALTPSWLNRQQIALDYLKAESERRAERQDGTS